MNADAAGPVPHAGTPSESPTILVIEDQRPMLEALLLLLEPRGYRVRAATTAEQGLGMLEGVQLVLLDLMLPGMDGYAACREIRERRPALPVVVLTARTELDSLVHAFAAGAEDYVTKPFRAVELIARIESRLRLHRAEEALRESEARYRRFFEDDLTGDFIASADGTLVECNAAFARIFGFRDLEEARGANLARLLPDPALRRGILKELRAQKRLELFEVRLRRSDGRSVDVIANLVASLDESGSLLEVKGYLFDVTERKALEAQLLQSQKMEVVGRLAGGIAHDFNNLLTVIRGNAQLAIYEAELRGDTPLLGYIQEIDRAAHRAGEMTHQLLAFSRKQALAARVVDLNSALGEMHRLLRRLIGEEIDLQLTMEAGLWPVRVDPGQLQQVAMNLVVNARDAMPRGGSLQLRTWNRTLLPGEGGAPAAAGAAPGDYVELTVTDSGQGILPEMRDRIFEPFFTTKEPGKGTGLGLSTAYGIVRQSGGFIWVESVPGTGSCFHILLPRAEEVKTEAEPEPLRLPQLPGGSETVLLVEDDDAVRDIAAVTLTGKGYRVLPAAGARDAIALCEKRLEPIDLLLTDVVMPETGGPALRNVLAPLYPEMRVLFISGHPVDLSHDLAAATPVDLLEKPFTPAALLLAVRAVLDRPPAQQLPVAPAASSGAAPEDGAPA
jgi:two-component system, cell cycle sensor histidine kinase and response regulator CckA